MPLSDAIVIKRVEVHSAAEYMLRLHAKHVFALPDYVRPEFYHLAESMDAYTVWSARASTALGCAHVVLRTGVIVGYKRGIAGTFVFSVAPDVPGYELMLAAVLRLSMEGSVDV